MNRIKEARIKKGITITKMAKDLEMAQSTLTNYENGKRKPRDNSTFIKIANYLDVSVPYIMGISEDIHTLYADMDLSKIAKVIKFTREIYKMSQENFVELINEYAKSSKGTHCLNISDLKKAENGTLKLNIDHYKIIADLADLDIKNFLQSNIVNTYNFDRIKNALNNLRIYTSDENLNNIVSALNDSKVVIYGISDIAPLVTYNENISNDSERITNKSTLLKYLENKIETYENLLRNNDELQNYPEELMMDISISLNFITNDVNRIKAFDLVFN